MTRDEYIQQQILAAKEYIRQQTTTRGKEEDWNQSLVPESIFSEVINGLLYELYGQIFDHQVYMTSLALSDNLQRAKINEIVNATNTIIDHLLSIQNASTYIAPPTYLERLP